MPGYLAPLPHLSDRSRQHVLDPHPREADRQRYRSELRHLLEAIRQARARHEAAHGPLPATAWASVSKPV